MAAGAIAASNQSESIAYRVIIVSAVGPAITIPVCLLRFYTKRYILRLITTDDYLIIPAVLLALAFSILTAYQTTNGLGKHISQVSNEQFTRLMKVGDIAGPIFYNLSTLFIKTSLSVFYLRLSPSRWFTISVYSVMAASIIYNLISAIGFSFACKPIASYWDFSILNGKCIDLNAYFLSMAVINAATDLVLLILPIGVMMHLHLPMRRKIGMALLLLTGAFVCVVSLIRMSIVIAGMKTVATDGTWNMVQNFIWILIEMWLGIICACLPSLYSFLRKYFPAIHERTIKPDLVAVQDPNSDRVEGVDHPESGYHSGQITDFSLRTVNKIEPHMSPCIRPQASDKSLLSTVSAQMV